MSVKTESETVFEEYLNCHSLDWEAVDTGPQKEPDYRIKLGSQDCIFEVKEFDDPKPRPKSSFDPCRPVRQKLKKAREKFVRYETVSCNVVLFNSRSIYRSLTPDVVAAAAFGEHFQATQSDMGWDGGIPVFRFFGSAVLTPEHNRTISSVILLCRYQLDEWHLEAYRRLRAKNIPREDIGPMDHGRLMEQVSAEDRPRYSFEGTLRAIVLDNPNAKIRLPLVFFDGPFDQRWWLEQQGYSAYRLGAELERLRADDVPFWYL